MLVCIDDMLLTVFCVWLSIAGVKLLSVRDVQLMTESLSHRILSYGNVQYLIANIQQVFHQFHSESVRIDGSALVKNISRVLGILL